MITRSRKVVCIAVAFILCAGCSTGGPGARPDRRLPGADPLQRGDLSIPYHLWREVREKCGYGERDVGLTMDEMRRYHNSAYRLPVVDRLFNDARRAPAMAAGISVPMLKCQTTAEPVRRAFALMGASTRAASPKKKDEKAPTHAWKVEWLDDAMSDDQAFDRLAEYCRQAGVADPVDESARRRWMEYPPAVKRLFLRLAIAVIEAAPRMASAYDRPFLEHCSFTRDGGPTHENLLKLALHLWRGDGDCRRDGLESYAHFDLPFLSFAVTHCLDRVDEAVAEWRAAGLARKDLALFAGKDVLFTTPSGTIHLGYRSGNSVPDRRAAVVIELGGDTEYVDVPVPERPLDIPVNVILDLGGNDSYTGAVAFGCYRASMVFDLAGDDTYRVKGCGLGCGLFGVGILRDCEGNDQYLQTGLYSEGAALAGVGLLMDEKGNDRYSCGAYSQGIGMTLGVGLLIDKEGNDSYHAAADDPEAFSGAWGRSVSLAQGIGFGRRADFDDGHSLGGGIGGLIDGAGDDAYDSGIFSQGSGYWYGFGFVEDLGGDDAYRAMAYSQGCGVHEAVGSLCDLSGNDRYNFQDGVRDIPFAKQLGASRDGSIGVFFDGAGDDTYSIATLMCGAGDITGVGLFWDRMGDDTYIISLRRDNVTTSCLGAAFPAEEDTGGDPQERFLTTGIFLDTGGNDTYDGAQYVDPYKKGGRLRAANDREWFHDKRPGFTGFGIDRDIYGGH